MRHDTHHIDRQSHVLTDTAAPSGTPADGLDWDHRSDTYVATVEPLPAG